LSRLFSLDLTKLDESKNKGLFTLRNGLLALQTDYNRYDKQPCVVRGNEHKFEDCEVLNSSGMTAEIAKKVFLFFNSLKKFAQRNNISDLNQLKKFSSTEINHVGSQPAQLSVQLLEAAQNPLDLFSNSSYAINSIQLQFQVTPTIANMNQLSRLHFDSNVAGVNQITNLPTNDNYYDTSISSQGSSASLFSIVNPSPGDNGDISSIGSTPTDSTDESTDFQWAGS